MAKRQPTKSGPPDQEINKALRVIRSKTGLAGIPKDLNKLSKRRKLAIFNKYRGVAEGREHVVKLSPKMAEQYEKQTLKGVRNIGNNQVVVPVEPGFTKTQVIKGEPLLKGAISQKRQLKNGELELVILPYQADKITDFIAEAKKHPQWDKLKNEADKWRFGFGDGTVEGSNWNANRYGSIKDVADYLQHYRDISSDDFSNAANRAKMRALVLVRTRGTNHEIENRRAEQIAAKVDRKKAANKRRFDKLRKQRGK